MSKFKVGDFVRVVDADNNRFLTLGAVYKVTRVGDALIYVEGIGPGHYKSRFELVEDQMTITGIRQGNKLMVGEIAIKLPPELVPVDPEIMQLRKLFAEYYRAKGSTLLAKNFESGQRDDRLEKILPLFREIKNA